MLPSVVFVRCCVIRRRTRPACEHILQPRLFCASSNSRRTPYGCSFSETTVDSFCASFYLKGNLLFAGRVRYAYVGSCEYTILSRSDSAVLKEAVAERFGKEGAQV